MEKGLIQRSVEELNQSQKYHIKTATDLGYNAYTIANKLKITIGMVESYIKAIELHSDPQEPDTE
jgi:hypothetical protein